MHDCKVVLSATDVNGGHASPSPPMPDWCRHPRDQSEVVVIITAATVISLTFCICLFKWGRRCLVWGGGVWRCSAVFADNSC